MKKLILLIAAIAVCIPALAQEHTARSLIKSGTALTMAGGVTSNLTTTVRSDAALWSNTDGTTANIALVASMVGTNANATNIVTFTLYTVPDGSNVSSASQNSFAVTLTGNGTTAVTMSTNIPTATILGAKAIRLSTVATGASSGGGGSVTVTAKIAGFAP